VPHRCWSMGNRVLASRWERAQPFGDRRHLTWGTRKVPNSSNLKMLFICLLTYALGQSIKAAPLASSNGIQLRDVPTTCDCTNASNQRSLFDIIWGCFFTLFACTWISVHPNIPSLSDSYFTIMWRRIRIMICALLVPEGVMYWAMRQWLGSRKLARQYKR